MAQSILSELFAVKVLLPLKWS